MEGRGREGGREGGTILAKRTQVTARLTPISMKMYFIATGS